MEPDLATVAAPILGSLAYILYFHRGEHFLYGVRYMQAFLIVLVTTTIAQSHYTNVSFRDSASVTVKYAALFLAGLYASCITYRLFFNPLNKFPGPYFARLTKFDHVFRNGKFDGHFVLLDMHRKYGKFVRIGPNDLSVIDADGTQVISAPNSKCYKAPWYAGDTPLISLHTTRDRAMHDRRRRIWSPAFSDKALRGYENRVQQLNDMLISHLEKSKGKSLSLPCCIDVLTKDRRACQRDKPP